MKHRSNIFFYLNGNPVEVLADEAGMMLADYLRQKKRLTGTKIVCAEGDCGACSVLRLPPAFKSGSGKAKQNFVAINSCITTVAQMDGSSLVTVDALAGESLGNAASELSSAVTAKNVSGGQNISKLKLTPVQKSMVDENGSQCGFCTPGFVMAITGLVEKKLSEGATSGFCTREEAKNCMTGNLCRCTGYEPILDATTKVDLAKCESIAKRFMNSAQAKLLAKHRATPILLKSERFSFYAPTKISDAIKAISKNKAARLIAAGTDLGVVHNKGKLELTNLVSLHLIPELYEIKKTAKSIRVGARVNLTDLRLAVKKTIPEFAKFLDLFASPQIKNLATLVGNVGNASPIADTPPFLLTMNAILLVQGGSGKRKIPIDQFYQGYRKTALKSGELITAIEFEVPKKAEHLKLYKVSQRKDLDISCVNAAFRIHFSKNKGAGVKIETLRLALGGVAPVPLRLKKTEAFLKGKVLLAKDGAWLGSENHLLLNEAVSVMQSEINPLDDLRGSGKFRRALVTNLFLKYIREFNLSENGDSSGWGAK